MNSIIYNLYGGIQDQKLERALSFLVFILLSKVFLNIAYLLCIILLSPNLLQSLGFISFDLADDLAKSKVEKAMALIKLIGMGYTTLWIGAVLALEWILSKFSSGYTLRLSDARISRYIVILLVSPVYLGGPAIQYLWQAFASSILAYRASKNLSVFNTVVSNILIAIWIFYSKDANNIELSLMFISAINYGVGLINIVHTILSKEKILPSPKDKITFLITYQTQILYCALALCLILFMQTPISSWVPSYINTIELRLSLSAIVFLISYYGYIAPLSNLIRDFKLAFLQIELGYIPLAPLALSSLYSKCEFNSFSGIVIANLISISCYLVLAKKKTEYNTVPFRIKKDENLKLEPNNMKENIMLNVASRISSSDTLYKLGVGYFSLYVLVLVYGVLYGA